MKTKRHMLALINAAVVLGTANVAFAGLWDQIKSKAESAVQNVANDVMDDVRKEEPASNTSSATSQAASAASKQNTVDIPVNAPKVDILGVQIGMTPAEVRRELESHGYKFPRQSSYPTSIKISSKLGTRELSGTQRHVKLWADKKGSDTNERVTLVFSLAPSASRLIAIHRKITYARIGPSMEKFISSLEDKYAKPTGVFNPMRDMYKSNPALLPHLKNQQSGEQLVWTYDKGSNLLANHNASLSLNSICGGGSLAKDFMEHYQPHISFSLLNDKVHCGGKAPCGLERKLKKTTCSAELHVALSPGQNGVKYAEFTLGGHVFAHDALEQTWSYARQEIEKDNAKAAAQMQQQSAPTL